MRCNYTDPRTGATHSEIIDDLRWHYSAAIHKLDAMRKRLKAIAEVIEMVESRAMAVDGPVARTRDEMTDRELKKIYRLAKKEL